MTIDQVKPLIDEYERVKRQKECSAFLRSRADKLLILDLRELGGNALFNIDEPAFRKLLLQAMHTALELFEHNSEERLRELYNLEKSP